MNRELHTFLSQNNSFASVERMQKAVENQIKRPNNTIDMGFLSLAIRFYIKLECVHKCHDILNIYKENRKNPHPRDTIPLIQCCIDSPTPDKLTLLSDWLTETTNWKFSTYFAGILTLMLNYKEYFLEPEKILLGIVQQFHYNMEGNEKEVGLIKQMNYESNMMCRVWEQMIPPRERWIQTLVSRHCILNNYMYKIQKLENIDIIMDVGNIIHFFGQKVDHRGFMLLNNMISSVQEKKLLLVMNNKWSNNENVKKMITKNWNKVEKYLKLIRKQNVFITPRGVDDDLFIILACLHTNSNIISNDRYRKYRITEHFYTWLCTKLQTFTFTGKVTIVA